MPSAVFHRNYTAGGHRLEILLVWLRVRRRERVAMGRVGNRMAAVGQRGVLERVEAFGLRVPFTLATVALIALAGWLTGTASGERLGVRAIARLGVSPADTFSFDLVRAMASALVTNGPLAFWTGIAATAVLVGLVELRSGSLRAVIAFWGSHLITLVLAWAILAPLHLAGVASSSLLYLARDVGPSAGYMGCLGYLLAGLRGPLRWPSLGVGVAVLTGMLAVGLRGIVADPAGVSAALSHLIALPVGFVLGVLTRKRQQSLPVSA
jgi:hypothetical protein